MQHQEFSNWLMDPNASPFPAGVVTARVSGGSGKKAKKSKKAIPLNANAAATAAPPTPTATQTPSQRVQQRGLPTSTSSSSSASTAPQHAAPQPPTSTSKPLLPTRAAPSKPTPADSDSSDESTDSLERVNNLPSLPPRQGNEQDDDDESAPPSLPTPSPASAQPPPVTPQQKPVSRIAPTKKRTSDTDDHGGGGGGGGGGHNNKDAFSDRPAAYEPLPPTVATTPTADTLAAAAEEAVASFLQHSTLDYATTMVDGFFDIFETTIKPIPQRVGDLKATHQALMLDGTRDAVLRRTVRDVARICRLTHDNTIRVRLLALSVVAALRDTEHAASVAADELHCRLVGNVRPGGVRERALVFKYIADRIPIASKLVRDGTRYWNLIVANKTEHVVDLVHRPGFVHVHGGSDAEAYVKSLADVSVNPFLNGELDYDTTTGDINSVGNDAAVQTGGTGSQSLRQRTMEQVNLNEDIEMLCKLGAGSFGEVWRAAIAGYTCAVKILRTSTMTLKEQTRVVSEVALLQELDHANIVRYLGREIRSNDDLLIIMEYVPHSLYDAVRRARRAQRRRFAAREIMNVTANIARGLFYLHTLRVPVIHRDLKSKNVLVEWDVDTEVISITKLCDFGVAKAMTESTVADSLVGTTRWMAPEIVNLLYGGKAVAYTVKADIWSLGMVLYEMIECQVPYQEVNQWDVKGFIARGIVPRVTNTDAGIEPLVQLLHSCLQVNPRNRPTAREYMASVLM
jgi:hypothetical protein